MKKIILLFSVLFSISTFGQDREVLNKISEVTFYGVDYSQVKVYGASETPYHFKYIFEEINNLFMAEPKKYNIYTCFKKGLTATNIDEVKARAGRIDEGKLMTAVESTNMSPEDLAKLIKGFPVKKGKGTGLIIVAELLDKGNNYGFYNIVFFDTETKQILDTWKASGKAGGIGLRNFWASSLLKAMKSVKF